MNLLRVLAASLVWSTSTGQAFDCNAGIYPGVGESNGILLHTTCGREWRFILSTPLKQDDDDYWGFRNNSYDYLVGVAYQWRWRKLRIELGLAYVNEETKLYLERQGPIWYRLTYELFPSVNCGVVHTSVVYVDDAGRNQIGCDYTFSFD
jgi:hypothetical protein